MKSNVRVRIAPSPTGYLHLGLARTALFNWLFARHNNGTFIMRIDDTDAERSTDESLRQIIESFKWLGLDWDEGYEKGGEYAPYIQSQRLDIYEKHTKMLLDSGKAYYCYCTQEELEEERKIAQAQKKAYTYSGKCRNLTSEQRKKYEEEGRRPSVRFLVEDKILTVHDLIKGDVEFRTGLFGDFIIVRPNGIPLYIYTSVVDDMLMKISHIIRADEHLANTPKQILIFEAFGAPLPEFAHVPLVLGSKGEKLSKRHGATSVAEYKKMGYLPEAMLNYLARLGWSLDDEKEVFTIDELIENFSLDRVGKSGGIFDQQKLMWLNGEYIMKMDIDSRTKAVIPFLQDAGLIDDIPEEKYEWLRQIVSAVGDRLKTLAQIVDYAGFFFVDKVEYDEDAVKKHLKKEGMIDVLKGLKQSFKSLDVFDETAIENAIKSYAESNGLNAGKLIQPLRVALTGKPVGPGIFETLILLGKEKVIQRLEDAILMLEQ
ncbi:TPA: glutamate--tRNA ligase [Candidatus Poribacteria bacterium]|nr:glutamate--tRNA ligase [Candidatus Poribacteria bacterium]